MKFPFFIAKRYLVSKKSQSAINFISNVSIGGVAVGTLALIVILSVFNGFDGLIRSLFSTFYPDIQITAIEGKVIYPDSIPLQKIIEIDGVEALAPVVEEDALLKYQDRYHLGAIKGIDDNYLAVTGLDSMLTEGEFTVYDGNFNGAVIGLGVKYYLGINLAFDKEISIYVPRRTSKISYNPSQAFKKTYVFPTGVYQVQQDIDSKYIFMPIELARELLLYTNEVSAYELKLKPQTSAVKVKEDLQQLIGEDYLVQTRYEQNSVFYKTMRSEKWMIFFILLFILFVASFNIIASLTMLIIEKKKDIAVIRSMGADVSKIKRIFLIHGWMITLTGAVIGIILGVIIVIVQQEFGVVQLGGGGSFITDAYPVQFKFTDTLLSLTAVMIIGFIAAWIPIRYITGRFVSQQNITAE